MIPISLILTAIFVHFLNRLLNLYLPEKKGKFKHK